MGAKPQKILENIEENEMLTFYIVGVVIVTLVTLSLLIWGFVNERTDVLDTGDLIVISLLSWVSLFIMVMTAIFMKLRKNKEDR